jgi:hypothetical protein
MSAHNNSMGEGCYKWILSPLNCALRTRYVNSGCVAQCQWLAHPPHATVSWVQPASSNDILKDILC